MQVPPEVFREKTIASWPYQVTMFAQDQVYFGYDYRTSPHANMFIFTCVLLAPGSAALNIICASMAIGQLRGFRDRLSKKTYQLHIRLIMALLIQVS
uniref:Uncharacterized protein n=1 Tax=Panagrolaimus sp. JU765 TaxID=591449 RepID=A0AC34QUG5_9BILA